MKRTIGIGLVIVAVLVVMMWALAWTQRSAVTPPSDTVVEDDSATTTEPARPSDEEIDAIAEDYVRTNISALSPEPEVLGGTYYVTAIETNAGRGTVSYEDGHVAHDATFEYRLADSGTLEVTSFTIVER